MKKSIQIILAVVIVAFAAASCKSKQKVTKIPGADIKATSATAAPVSPVQNTPTASEIKQSVSEPEVTRSESFKLADNSTSSDVLKNKYHVVVGSFKSQTNAYSLQTSLKNEGNNAFVVVNEQGMYRVVIASFNDYTQAHVRIKEINNRFPDAWVLIQK